MIKKIILYATLLFAPLFGENGFSSELNATLFFRDTVSDNRVKDLLDQKAQIDSILAKENVWIQVYTNYEMYEDLSQKSKELSKNIKKLKNRSSLTQKETMDLMHYENENSILNGKITQLKEYKNDPFKRLLEPADIGETPKISSPLDIISAISFRKKISEALKDYNDKFDQLLQTIDKLHEEKGIINELLLIEANNKSYKNELKNIDKKLFVYEKNMEILKTSKEAFEGKVIQLENDIDESLTKEMKKAVILISILIILFVLLLVAKHILKKYMYRHPLFYTINKTFNITYISLSIIILLFAYLENVGHLVTILSFASAGIAIALKDWFTSMMGWLVIIFSGSIHVGDRIRFSKNGVEYVGDVVDISLLRITLHEDITLTTFTTNRRAGRIIFIPNNYIFTDMIANYSHSGSTTVWDGIDFVITFESDTHKAQQICKEIAKKYSKGYVDMTRKNLNSLRSKYSLRNISVEPRVFAFLDTYGVKISVWYLTNAYATLALRSTISMDILAKFKLQEDITIAIPMQSIHINNSKKESSDS